MSCSGGTFSKKGGDESERRSSLRVLRGGGSSGSMSGSTSGNSSGNSNGNSNGTGWKVWKKLDAVRVRMSSKEVRRRVTVGEGDGGGAFVEPLKMKLSVGVGNVVDALVFYANVITMLSDPAPCSSYYQSLRYQRRIAW